MQVATLLTHFDEEAYILIRSLCAPEKPATKKFVDIVKIMTEHLNPKPSELKVALRDQLVCGIHDESTRVELFKLTDLTFDKALKEATARESATKNAAGVVKTLASKDQREEVLAMNRTEKTDKGQPQSRYKKNQQSRVIWRVPVLKRRASNRFLRASKDKGEGSSSSTHDQLYDFHSLRAKDDENACNFPNNIKADPLYIKVELNSKTVSMKVDSGTYYAVMSEAFKNKNFRNWKIDKCCTNVYGYVQNAMTPIGQPKNLKVNLNNPMKTFSCPLLKGNGPPLIGRQWLAEFGVWPNLSDIAALSDTNKMLNLNVNDVREKMVSEFNVLFGGTTGLYNKREIKLHVNGNTKPVALRARHVPYTLKIKVENEIERLEKLSHLKKVESSEWAMPIVLVLESNGEVRICGDFKITVNPNLHVIKRPFPRIDDIFQVLQKGSSFSQLDLPHAYMQIPVDKKSQELLTITTHVGFFRYTKMTAGTAPAPGEFQQIMDECLQGIPNTIGYLDNSFLTFRTDKQHLENLRKVCKQLEERGLRLNRGKCDFMKERIKVLGSVIDAAGLHKARSKVKAMVEAPRPTNSKQLASFLGLINFYARFLMDRSEKLKLLFDGARRKKFVWTKECEEASH
ncbi:uncharacterized protein K02A2.6-like [Diprion similis]|uniref:uncharacterized protein K02A2.6-like n=1 Tax=Diprion similis TaxID=362088 RepID=UPI001EF7903A|nr:uncharacterized protein K02A2.6-like [Diprion similis]